MAPQQQLQLSTDAQTTASTEDPSVVYVSTNQEFFEMIHNNKISSGKDADDYSELPVTMLRCGIKESDLKFRTVAYGRMDSRPYILPQEHKVIMIVNVSDIPFETDLQKEIFFQIVGPRYIAERDELRMQSKQFASRIENKRHVVSMLERIMESAKKLAETSEWIENERTVMLLSLSFSKACADYEST